ncbi:hypothetical protein FXO38_18654 [Capsicum annuum]|nr:hypothetical protein FXO38_18654 [Capsicum annuum]KAF3650298.1 hypothetical protein FXO37_18539 [Capsicum annuum]
MDTTPTNGGHPTNSHFDSRPNLLSPTSSRDHEPRDRGAGKGILVASSSNDPAVGLSTSKLDGGLEFSIKGHIPNHIFFTDHLVSQGQSIPNLYLVNYILSPLNSGTGSGRVKTKAQKHLTTGLPSTEQYRNRVLSQHPWRSKSKTLIARSTLYKNFDEPFNSVIIAYSPDKIKIFSLMVKNTVNKISVTVILSRQVLPNGKESTNASTNQ